MPPIEWVIVRHPDPAPDGTPLRLETTPNGGIGMVAVSAEQEARDLLERLGMPDAQSLTAGDVVELANLISELRRLRAFARNA